MKATASARSGGACCCRAEAARNTIFGYFPKAQGAGYQLDRIDFLTSNAAQQFAGTDFKGGKVNSEIQTFFRPSDVAVGPDGAIYVADWFDPRVGGHDDKDDTTSGAIYRIAPKGFKPVVPKSDLTTLEGQLTALRSSAVNVRAAGFSGLAERGTAAIPAIEALLRDENPFIRARAVWVLARLGVSGIERVESLTSDADPMMRVVAFRTLRQMGQAQRFADKLARDPSAAVRREVALSLRDVPFYSARDIAARARQRLRRQGPQLSRGLGHRRHEQRRSVVHGIRGDPTGCGRGSVAG